MAPKRVKQIHDRETGKDLPEQILHGVIFPRLSFKTLCRFKCLSKDVKELLSPETTMFWTEQTLCPSPSSTSFMYVEKGSLRFFPEPKIIGVPDPSLDLFLFNSQNHVELISSTNGLAIFRACVRARGRITNTDDVFYICNLATREIEMIPEGLSRFTETLKRVTDCIGLAFDPSKFPNNYRLVNPLHGITDHGRSRIVSFDVFRSETGKWTRSVQEIYARGDNCHNSDDFSPKPIYSNGLIYWNCSKYVMWFDPEKDRAGTLEMPFRTLIESSHEIGTFNQQVYCISKTAERFGVWVLKNGTQWEKRYNVKWQELKWSFETRIKKSIDFCEKNKYATPLAFDGRCVYIALRITPRAKKEELLCFNMEEKSISMSCKSIIRGNGRVLNYHNCVPSMPKISRSTN